MTLNILLSPVRSFARLLGIDMNVLFVLLTRCWTAIAGIVTILVVGQFLSKTEQGYLYTFNNLLGMKIFFELGLSNIIMTFASHEKPNLKLEDGKITGNSSAFSRLSSLLRKSIKMYSVIGALILIFLMIGGFFFFVEVDNQGEEIFWQIPWAILVIVSALRILFLPINAVISGCGFMKNISRNRMIELILSNIVLWTFLVSGFNLYALAFSATAGLLVMIFLIYKEFAPYVSLLWKKEVSTDLSWKKEILPLQTKSGLSAILSWVILQLSTPILMSVQDPIVAGQMGMTLSCMAIVSQLGFFWMRARAPELSHLIASKEFKKADSFFYHILIRVTLIVILGFSTIIAGRWIVEAYEIPFLYQYVERVLSLEAFIYLSFLYLTMHFWNTSEIYLRCYKKEPYFIGSIILGIAVAFVQYYSAKHYTVEVLCMLYALTVFVIVMVIGSYIFFIKRKTWQTETA